MKIKTSNIKQIIQITYDVKGSIENWRAFQNKNKTVESIHFWYDFESDQTNPNAQNFHR